jgi:hypothetical protein
MSPSFRARRIGRALGWIALALVVVYVVALLASGLSLSRAQAALRAAGRPMDPAAIVPPPVPDVENGALLYNAAIQILKATPWQPDPTQPAKPLIEVASAEAGRSARKVQSAAAAFWEARFRDPAVDMAIALVEQGNARPACRFDVEANTGRATVPLDDIGQLGLGWILAGKALVEAREGKTQEAWQTVLTGLRLARALRGALPFVTQFVAGAMADTALDLAARLQGQAPPDPATSSALAETLDALSAPGALAVSIDAERLLFFERVFARDEGFNFLASGSRMGWLRRAARWLGRSLYASPVALPLWQWDHACCLRVLGEAAGVMARPYDQANRKLLDDLRRSVPWYCLISHACIGPRFGSYLARHVTHLARVRVARIALALLATRSEGGGFPEDLSSLVAAGIDIADPFTGKPLVYRTTANGFLLYSLGPDQHDDSGTPVASGWEGWDVVWAFPPPAPAE